MGLRLDAVTATSNLQQDALFASINQCYQRVLWPKYNLSHQSHLGHGKLLLTSS
jgi:hypothetical protein